MVTDHYFRNILCNGKRFIFIVCENLKSESGLNSFVSNIFVTSVES